MNLPFQFRILPAALIGAGLLLAGKVGVLLVDHDAPAAEASSRQRVATFATISPAAGKPEAEKAADAEDGQAAEDGEAAKGDKAAKSEKAAKDTKDAKDATTEKPVEEAAGDKAEPAKADAGAVEAEEGDKAEADAADEAGASGARLGLDDENFDPMMLSRAEIELLQGLSKRRAALEERERAFALKEQTLAAAEQKLDAKIKALEELKKTVEAMLGQYDKQEEQRLASLVKIYESMKPKEAAAILQGLEQDTLLDVIERMKESKSASILALLNPARAKMITEEMIARRRLPKPEENS